MSDLAMTAAAIGVVGCSSSARSRRLAVNSAASTSRSGRLSPRRGMAVWTFHMPPEQAVL